MNETKYEFDNVAIRLVKEPPLLLNEKLCTPEKVVEAIRDFLSDFDREVVVVLNLSTACKPINMNIVSIGTVNASLASPREIFKSSILSNAANIILVHNHPSGDCTPSKSDFDTTKMIKAAGELLGINLIDSIIVGSEGYYSIEEGIHIKNIDDMDWSDCIKSLPGCDERDPCR